MTELELDVVEAAIEYVHQRRHGLYRTEPKYFRELELTVDKLEMAHDGKWKRPEETDG